jgi:hypothetical protein
MKMQEVVSIAKEMGLRPGKSKKAELIRQIQATEGNADCYGCEGASSCDQHQCLWREDCLSDSRKMTYQT